MLGWNEVVLELLELNGKPVCVTIGEIGGAGAEVAVFSGTLWVGEPEHPATEDEVSRCGSAGTARWCSTERCSTVRGTTGH